MTPQVTTGGYMQVRLRSNGKYIPTLVHRLVATLYIDNPDKLPEVNHKDKNVANNNVTNLEWCSREGNMLHAVGKKINQYDLNDNFIASYNSSGEAGRAIGKSRSHIGSCLIGTKKTAYGFKWKYAE